MGIARECSINYDQPAGPTYCDVDGVYETLGFDVVEGGHVKDCAVLHDGEMTIGLYSGIELLPLATIKTGWGPEVEPIDIIEKVPELLSLIK